MVEDEKDNITDFEPDTNNSGENSVLPYKMLGLLLLLILGLFAVIVKTINDVSEHVNINTSNTPVRAFGNSKPVKTSSLPAERTTSKFEDLKNTGAEPVRLMINPLECYNGNSKSEMYDIRKTYVKTSIFYTSDYVPDEEVFGRIEDGKPWWHIDPCSRDGGDNVTGISSLSRFINSPDILVPVYFSFNLSYRDDVKEYCDGNFARTVPKEAFYNPSYNMITVKYPMSKYVTNHRVNHYYGQKGILYPLVLSGLNARDFGYDYVYINKKYNIGMVNEENNASKHVHKFLDFIHVGGSCKHPDGCNNHSPYQGEIEFVITSIPAEMTLKLWKKEPFSKDLPADINYRIIFEEE